MFSTENGNGNGFFMPVAPAYGYGNNGGFGMGGDWAWIILLLLAFGGGWGNGFGGGFGGGELYPWLNNSQNINGGFRDQFLNSQIGDIQNTLTTGFGNTQMAMCNGFNQAEIAANNRQMADMQQNFALQSALQNCCCENRAATADLKYTVATEACADRAANGANTQKILDKLCQLELDNERAQHAADQREIARLNSELMYARGQASQIDQTAQIRASQATVANQLVNELRSCPIPSQPVYGNQPIFTCNNNNNGGCVCNNGFVN